MSDNQSNQSNQSNKLNKSNEQNQSIIDEINKQILKLFSDTELLDFGNIFYSIKNSYSPIFKLVDKHCSFNNLSVLPDYTHHSTNSQILKWMLFSHNKQCQSDITKIGWWTDAFSSSIIDSITIDSKRYNTHLIVMSLIAQIAGFRFQDFDSFNAFYNQLYYYCKNKFALWTLVTNAKYITYNITKNMSVILTIAMIAREKRLEMMVKSKCKLLCILNKKFPTDISRQIFDYIGYGIEDLRCKYCLIAKRSYNIAISHTTIECKYGCLKCKIMGRTKQFYNQHIAKNCPFDNDNYQINLLNINSNKCAYCKSANRSSNHFITECKYLSVNYKGHKIDRCYDCKSRCCDYKSHTLRTCKYVKKCVYCYSLNLDKAKNAYTHTLKDCSIYERDYKRYSYYKINQDKIFNYDPIYSFEQRDKFYENVTGTYQYYLDIDDDDNGDEERFTSPYGRVSECSFTYTELMCVIKSSRNLC